MSGIDITSANSDFVITVTKLQISQKLQQYAVDSAWSLDEAETAVAQVGVDGYMSAGWVPRLNTMTLNFAANSESVKLFDMVVNWQDTNRTICTLQGVLTLPSVNKAFTLSNGVITRHKTMPDGGRVLAPHSVGIHWERVRPAVI